MIRDYNAKQFNEEIMQKNISVIGLGRVGLPVAVFFASRGFRVIGVDTNLDVVKAVNNQRCPYEPGLAELMNKSQCNLAATGDYNAIKNSGLTLITVPTPSNKDGSYSTGYVEAATKGIAEELKGKQHYHLIVLVSTVMPGDTENKVLPLLKNSGGDFGLCYSPEFVALGNAIENLTNPDFILIGEYDRRSGEWLSQIYSQLCPNSKIVRTNLVNAELAKLFLNNFILTKISFANMMAEVCDRIPDASVDTVSEILGYDSRIGRKCLTGGLAWGGPCYPRDPEALWHLARKMGTKTDITDAAERVNRQQCCRVITSIRQKLGRLENKKIAVLGLTYKPDTDSIIESPSIDIIKELLKNGARVIAYDPRGMKNAKGVLGEKVAYSMTAKGCLKQADLCLIATPWDEFKELTPRDFGNCKVLDPWRILENLSVNSNLSTWPS